jgi:hypothetical protein
VSAGSAARAVPLRTSAQPHPVGRAESAARRVLRLVPQRRSQAAKTPFAVVLVVVLGGGLLGLLLLNTLVAQDSFALHDLAKQSRDLQQREQQLAGQVQALQAPAQLAASATRLGMVPGGPPAFLRLPDGHVLGAPTAGRALPRRVTATPPPAPSASPARTASRTAARPAAPTGSTTWTAPRQSPPPTTGAHR